MEQNIDESIGIDKPGIDTPEIAHSSHMVHFIIALNNTNSSNRMLMFFLLMYL